MEKKEISEIERNIILSHLTGNDTIVQVSIGENIVEISSKQMQSLDKGIVLITNPSSELMKFSGKDVYVKFNYNGVSLFFPAQMKNVRAGLAFVMPLSMNANENKKNKKNDEITSKFAVSLFYVAEEISDGIKYKNKNVVECNICDEYFETPNDNFMKNITQYLSEKPNDAFEIPDVVFLNQEKIVIAFPNSKIEVEEKSEFAAWIRFPLKRPLKERKIYISFVIEKIFSNKGEERFCALGKLSAIKLEDMRFLMDMFNSAH